MFRKTRRSTWPHRLQVATVNNGFAPVFMEDGYPQVALYHQNPILHRFELVYPSVYPHLKRRNTTVMPFSLFRPIASMNSPAYMGFAGGPDMYHHMPVAPAFPGADFYQGSNNKQQTSVAAILQNPLQPVDESAKPVGYGTSIHANPYAHPYPKGVNIMKQPSGIHSIMNSFKTQEGSIDVKKMIDTAGQMAYAVNQVQSLVKGLGGILKI